MTRAQPDRDLLGLTDIARRRQNRRLVTAMIALFVGPLIIVFLVLAIRHPAVRLSPSAVIGLLAILAAGPLLGWLFVTAARHRGASWVQPTAFGGLDSRSRRRLLRSLRRGEPIEDEDREVAAQLAQQVRRSRWLPIMCTLPMFIQARYLGRSGFLGAFAVVAVTAGVGLGAWSFYVQWRIASRTDI